jgi:hypothetical protein
MMTTRTILTLLMSATVAVAAGQAAAQAPAPAAPPGGTANTLSTGTVANTNSNSNSQFYSGGNTGVNNGALEVYAGADPYQGIIIEGSPSLPQLPGFVPPASNFSQPYKPDTFVNGPAFLPKEMTLSEAKACRDSSVRWYGSSHTESTSIKLFYAAQKESPGVPMTMANYVGTAVATASDRPFVAALCEAAYKAMNQGATQAVVDFIIRPKNTMYGVGFGTSGGVSGLPTAGTHPYAIAGALGFGTGWSNQKVEGEVMLQLTALRDSRAAPATSRAAPTPQVQRAAMAAASPATTTPASHELTMALHPPESLAKLKRGDSKSRVFEIFPTSYVTRKGRTAKVEGLRLRLPQRSPRGTLFQIGEVVLGRPGSPGMRYWLLFENDKLLAWGQPHQWGGVARRYRLEAELDPGGKPLPQQAQLDEVR